MNAVLAQDMLTPQAIGSLSSLGTMFGASFVLCVLFGVFIYYRDKAQADHITKMIETHRADMLSLIASKDKGIADIIDVFKGMMDKQSGAIEKLSLSVTAVAVEMAGHREIMRELANVAEGKLPIIQGEGGNHV